MFLWLERGKSYTNSYFSKQDVNFILYSMRLKVSETYNNFQKIIQGDLSRYFRYNSFK